MRVDGVWRQSAPFLQFAFLTLTSSAQVQARSLPSVDRRAAAPVKKVSSLFRTLYVWMGFGAAMAGQVVSKSKDISAL